MAERVGTIASRTERTRGAAQSFGLRLAATLLVTLAVLGIIGYEMTARDIESRVRAEVLAGIERQGSALAAAHGVHDDAFMGEIMVRAIMDGMASELGAIDVALFAPDGEVVVAADGSHRGQDPQEANGPAAAADRAMAEVVRAVSSTSTARVSGATGDHAAYEFWVPVDLGNGTHVLHVGHDRSVIDGPLADARRQSLMVVLLGLPVGTAIFYILGGRSLVKRHRRAVDSSTRDGLTGLGNHRAFQEDVRRALARADRLGQPVACALIDIDNFKELNDQAGHSFGDVALRRVAHELTRTREGDVAYRVGGDEFAVLMEPASAAEAAVVLERVRRAIAARLSNVTISVGIADSELAKCDADDLIQRADAALYEAKHSGRNRLEVFHDEIWESRNVSPEEQRALRHLLASEDVGVALQPIFDLRQMEPVGYEALARFADDGVFAGPADAFAVAHRTGRVHELDAVCRRAAFRAGRESVVTGRLFVNVSPEVFGAGESLAAVIAKEVADAGLTPDRVVIEVTEQRIVDPARLRCAIEALRSCGFQVALDDVGAGNAGLELLRLVELDIIKIDRSVITGAVEPGPARGVLFAILAFARESGSYVIAEGIETREQLAFIDQLCEQGVAALLPKIHAGQGYLLGRPAVPQASIAASAAAVAAFAAWSR